MNEQLAPDEQRHLQVLQSYVLAMEEGDIDTIANILLEAQHDRELENMVLEVNDFYQQEDQTTADVTDVTLVQQLLLNTLPVTQERSSSVVATAQSSSGSA